jgi:hypothetical protein
MLFNILLNPFTFITLTVIGIILFIVGGSYKNINPDKQKSVRKKLYISGGVFVGLGVILGSYVLYDKSKASKSKSIATSILEEKDPSKYMDLCTNLVDSTKDTGIISDFNRMKTERPIKEVQNFCGNMAKSTLGKA